MGMLLLAVTLTVLEGMVVSQSSDREPLNSQVKRALCLQGP